MRFDDEPLLEDFQRYCTSNDISFGLKRLSHPSEPIAGGQYGLSRKQRANCQHRVKKCVHTHRTLFRFDVVTYRDERRVGIRKRVAEA